MKEFLQHLKSIYKPKSISEVVADELDHAQRKLLDHQASADYHQHMTAFYKTVIDRLVEYRTNLKDTHHDHSLKSTIASLHDQQVGRRNT